MDPGRVADPNTSILVGSGSVFYSSDPVFLEEQIRVLYGSSLVGAILINEY